MTTPATPALPQHMTALGLAQHVRLHRAALRREIRSYKGPDSHEVGRCKLAAVLALPAEDRQVFATARVSDMLCWVRNFYKSTAERYLYAIGVSEFATVEEMTDRQRLKLVELLEGGIEAVKEAELDREVRTWAAEQRRKAAS